MTWLKIRSTIPLLMGRAQWKRPWAMVYLVNNHLRRWLGSALSGGGSVFGRKVVRAQPTQTCSTRVAKLSSRRILVKANYVEEGLVKRCPLLPEVNHDADL